MGKPVIIDQNLLEGATNGDTAALEQIICKMEPLIKSLSAYYHIDSGDEEDLRQEARYAVAKAVNTYDAAQNDSFVAYAVLCIKSALLSAVRSDARHKTRVLSSAVELSDEIEQSADSAEKVVLRKEEISNVNRKISEVLSTTEKKALLLFADGYTYKEIADFLGITPKAVDNALARARAKLL